MKKASLVLAGKLIKSILKASGYVNPNLQGHFDIRFSVFCGEVKSIRLLHGETSIDFDKLE